MNFLKKLWWWRYRREQQRIIKQWKLQCGAHFDNEMETWIAQAEKEVTQPTVH